MPVRLPPARRWAVAPLALFLAAGAAAPTPRPNPNPASGPGAPGRAIILPPGEMAGLGMDLAREAAGDLPDFEDVSEGFEKVISTADGESLFDLWRHDKDRRLIMELLPGTEAQHFFMIGTIAAGDEEAGVASDSNWATGFTPARTLYWQRIGDQVAFIEPQSAYRTSGDRQSQDALSRVYTDRVVLSAPIIAEGPSGGPVIDLNEVLLDRSDAFLGWFGEGADFSLTTIELAKAFPKNVEVAYRFPRADGRLATVRYSIAMPEQSEGYEPREADRRVGYFYVDHTDRARNDGESQKVRYVTRWHLEKAAPELKLSPPKKPIVYYIEHTTPIRYRRWVREGILAWNRAFEKVGIVGAIEVRQQDAATGAHMDIDPEDVRYSFVRWTNSHMGYAIGPSHAFPDTGEIYNADVVLDEGFISGYAQEFKDSEIAAAAMSRLHPRLAPWLAENPRWDPRWLLARPADRPRVAEIARRVAAGEPVPPDAPPTVAPHVWAAHRGAAGRDFRACTCALGMATQVSMARLAGDLGMLRDAGDGAGEDDASLLDGLPEEFVGPMLKDLVMHEVGHTLGLMHNRKGSSVYGLAEINADGSRGKRTWSGSVMDYNAVNIIVEGGELRQGDFVPIDIGPYDEWAIEWGYTDKDPDAVAARAAAPELAFLSDEGDWSADPLAKPWDLGANSLDFAEERIRFVERARSKIVSEIVDDGESWQKARDAYQRTLVAQAIAVFTATDWIGGAHINRFRKGDTRDGTPEGEPAPDPVVPVDAEQQRRALRFVVDHAFRDEAYGFTPDLARKLTSDVWWDESFFDQDDFPAHDWVMTIQSISLSMILNPVTLQRVQDNALRVDAGADALTIPEVLRTLREGVWASVAAPAGRAFSDRQPMVSGFQRTLQAEHLARLIPLATGNAAWFDASGATLTAQARHELREIRSGITAALQRADLDSGSRAHLAHAGERIDRALEAAYIRYE